MKRIKNIALLIFALLITIAPIYTANAVTPENNQPSIIRRSEGAIRGKAIQKVVPEYPQEAKDAKVEGDVQLEILIDEDGLVANAKVIRGPELLREASITAVKQWKFERTTVDGNPCKVSGVFTFRFQLEPEK